MQLFSKFIQTIRSFHHVLLRPTCLLCGTMEQVTFNLCKACLSDLPILPNCCRICGRFFSQMRPSDLTCGICLKNRPPYELTFALYPYESIVVQFILALKFQHVLSYATVFGELMTQQIISPWYKKIPLPDLIIPVPLHKARLHQRGFNQAVEIAKVVASSLKLDIETTNISRVKHTAPQSGLKADERQHNMMNAFAVNQPGCFTGLRVAILDDVITTGATIHALAKTIQKNGAKSIHVWCCARRG